MKALRTIRNYLFYCGIERDEYNRIKEDAYVSNFVVWRILHFFMAAVFAVLCLTALVNDLLKTNEIIYLAAFLYSASVIVFFFVFRKDSKVVQVLIYLSIFLLFLFGCFISKNNPVAPATTFIALLLITPMFIIGRPFFMAIELSAAATVFAVWMRSVKAYDVWMVDLINVIIFTIVGIFLGIIANAVRIREFVLTRKLNIQKDTDELTGLRNKSALTREINAFLADSATNRGVMFVLDVDRFKSINDTFGHDVGDSVIEQIGGVLRKMFVSDEIVGRFGGDEFIIFLKNTNDRDVAGRIAEAVCAGTSEQVSLPETGQKVRVSIGIALYGGVEISYTELFKKADTALYRAKSDPEHSIRVYE
ncbi:MAG: GGDEF domain-containing protein [Lachnospiraceae bacterium]|nr:GGDEF domain-containing protein [Lachnospiraceae bacterium]